MLRVHAESLNQVQTIRTGLDRSTLIDSSHSSRAGKVLSQDELASVAAHLLTAAKEAGRGGERLPDGAGYDVSPSAISLAEASGKIKIVLWFGQAGINFPLDPDMGKELFAAVITASAGGQKH